MRTIPIASLPQLFAALGGERQLWLPIEKDGRVEFGPWRDGAAVRLDGKTGKSGKDFFFPQAEDIVSFRTSGKNIEISPAERPDAPFVVVGMRGCDAAGMAVLDKVFLAEPVDHFYAARREAGTVVTLACDDPEDSCFCASFGIDPAAPGGDVTVWRAGENLYWQPLTDKGEKLTAELGPLLRDAGADGDRAVAAARERIAGLAAGLPFAGLKAPEANAETETALFASPVWEKLSESCLGCGTCTFVCPTCQCYDIQDRDTGDAVKRFRCWDSCMYSDFTLMAHGNPRTTQLQRYRQRFMHKLMYFPRNNDGVYSCVGCGRCVERCPSGLNIVRVMKAMEATR